MEVERRTVIKELGKHREDAVLLLKFFADQFRFQFCRCVLEEEALAIAGVDITQALIRPFGVLGATNR